MKTVVVASVRRQWPLAVLLVVLAVLDAESTRGLDLPGRWWLVPGVVVLAALALLAPARPITASLAAAATLAGWSVVLRLAGAEVLAGLTVTEFVALAAIVVPVVRLLPRAVAAGLAGLLLLGGAAGLLLRPPYWPAPGEPDPWWGVSLSGMAMVVLPVLYGLYLRGRDRDRDRAGRAAVAAARQRERLELARELHDVVAHQVGGMVVQAQAARALSSTDPGAAARVMPAIERTGMDALSAMRRLVAALREGEQAAPVRTTDLAADLRALTAAGSPPVRLTVELGEPVAGEVATSVLRLVQESVANARRHAAGAREITATVRTAHGTIRVEIHDDGRAPRAIGRYRGGLGLIGMRERVHLLGGRFTAGRAPGGGWQVTAEVPLHRTGGSAADAGAAVAEARCGD
ncbi:sensor histidine kinase [Actinoplanes awajinensis]|uniref:sensor histidine kinase n=1 Tax=Actinoplanes awajinensis TaxID=135946 RepID=UPI0012FC76E9|nr:histidine kinase [Actinoplanes awajinensis]